MVCKDIHVTTEPTEPQQKLAQDIIDAVEQTIKESPLKMDTTEALVVICQDQGTEGWIRSTLVTAMDAERAADALWASLRSLLNPEVAAELAKILGRDQEGS